MEKGNLQWCAGRCEELFSSGLFDTKEEAVKFVMEECDGHGFIGRGVPYTVSEAVAEGVCAHHIIEGIEDCAYENIGEAAECMFDLSEDDMAELEEIITKEISAYMEQKSNCGIKYRVENIQEYPQEAPNE